MFGIESGFHYVVFAKSVGVGFLLAVFFGLLILLRKGPFRGKAFVFFQDLFFFAISAVVSFVFLLDVNCGVPRGYIFFGEALGFSLFFLYKLPIR